MKAYQCDKCGKFFTYPYRDVDKIFVTGSRTSTMYIHDLCDGCQSELEAWWMMGKKKKEAEDERKRSN